MVTAAWTLPGREGVSLPLVTALMPAGGDPAGCGRPGPPGRSLGSPPNLPWVSDWRRVVII